MVPEETPKKEEKKEPPLDDDFTLPGGRVFGDQPDKKPKQGK